MPCTTTRGKPNIAASAVGSDSGMSKNFKRERVNVGTIMKGPYEDIRSAWLKFMAEIAPLYPSIKFPLKCEENPDGFIVAPYPLRIVERKSK